jgi:hypothetical protein
MAIEKHLWRGTLHTGVGFLLFGLIFATLFYPTLSHKVCRIKLTKFCATGVFFGSVPLLFWRGLFPGGNLTVNLKAILFLTKVCFLGWNQVWWWCVAVLLAEAVSEVKGNQQVKKKRQGHKKDSSSKTKG